MITKVKFVQIVTAPDSDQMYFYVLDDRGRVWQYGQNGFELCSGPDEPESL